MTGWAYDEAATCGGLEVNMDFRRSVRRRLLRRHPLDDERERVGVLARIASTSFWAAELCHAMAWSGLSNLRRTKRAGGVPSRLVGADDEFAAGALCRRGRFGHDFLITFGVGYLSDGDDDIGRRLHLGMNPSMIAPPSPMPASSVNASL
jgi:hypothetical protein